VSFLTVHQIYFDDGHLPLLDYTPYRNERCTVYFENSVIKSLVDSGAHEGSDYFGVVSYKLREKLEYTRDPRRGGTDISNYSERTFTPEDFRAELERQSPDAMSFQRHRPHDPITLANHFHGNFSHYFQRIMAAIGYAWTPAVFADIFYFNYFVARADIYKRYVDEMLSPAMAVMDQMPELMQSAGYTQLPEPLRAQLGISFYPYHSFLCERFFSYFAHVHRLKCAHY
jgi:hypothetical protein